MIRTSFALAALASFASVPTAQTAGATVRTPCFQPAPADSLRAQPLSPRVYVPDPRGVSVIECESIGPLGSWARETSCSGYAGDSYLRWAGPDLFSTPGRDILSFRFFVPIEGEYLIRVRVRHDHADSSLQNDCWARMDGGNWEKLFHNTGSGEVGVWTWNPIYESTHGFPRHFLTRGVHEFQISGRSYGFKIDRVAAVPLPVWFASENDPESRLARQRPILGQTLTVEVDDPLGRRGFQPWQTASRVFIGYPTSAYPCGDPSPLGEFLLDTTRSLWSFGPAQVWNGTDPMLHTILLPNDASLAGKRFSVQGVMYEPAGWRVALTDALDLELGFQ